MELLQVSRYFFRDFEDVNGELNWNVEPKAISENSKLKPETHKNHHFPSNQNI